MGSENGTVQARQVHATTHGDGTSLIEDPKEAALLYSKGYYGAIGPGGGLSLNAMETLYLSEVCRIEVCPHDGGKRSLTFRELLHSAQTKAVNFEILYLVYRDLRQRGYVVRGGTGGVDFSVLPRGGSYPSTPSLYWIAAISERTPFSLRSLTALMERARGARKKLLLGIVDEESDITYYLARTITPKGHHESLSLQRLFEGMLLDDRVSIFEPDTVKALGESDMFGSRVGDRLELSLLEALHLMNSGCLSLQDGRTLRTLSKKGFLTKAMGIEGDLKVRLPVYSNLRGSGLIPKTGFKYGAHFRAYEGNPATTHARYLIHAVAPGFTTTWPELSRVIRVAHGVRKSFLLSWSDEGESVRYINIQRIRP